jgi:thiamine-phosphate pyrophosphorylase
MVEASLISELLSPSLQRVLERAGEEARRRRSRHVEPGDLLQAMVLDETNAGAMILAAHGWALERGEPGPAAAEPSSADGQSPTDDETPAGLDAESVAVLQLTRTFAAQIAEEQAGCEQLLMALLERWRPIDALLSARGIDGAAILAAWRARPEADPAPLPAIGAVDLDLRETFEQTDIARLVDANLNRAREGMRVAEDYARFALDHRAAAEELKTLRHEIREALEYLPEHWLAAGRETERDVGVDIRTGDEYRRNGLVGIVTANFKRAQEALRTLEEVAKVESFYASERLERIRYRLYALERLLLIARRARDRLAEARLCWLVDPDDCVKTTEWMVREAVEGGVDIVQLRMKRASDRRILEMGRWFRKWTGEIGCLLIVNDRPDLARLIHADGVHLGQDDLPVKEARRIVGPDALIGVSTHQLDDVRRAERDGADYLGAGPIFSSRTKDFESLAGLEYLRSVRGETALPTFAIGGIHLGNIDDVIGVGGDRVAVSHVLCSSEEPRRIAVTLKQALNADRAAR